MKMLQRGNWIVFSQKDIKPYFWNLKGKKLSFKKLNIRFKDSEAV